MSKVTISLKFLFAIILLGVAVNSFAAVTIYNDRQASKHPGDGNGDVTITLWRDDRPSVAPCANMGIHPQEFRTFWDMSTCGSSRYLDASTADPRAISPVDCKLADGTRDLDASKNYEFHVTYDSDVDGNTKCIGKEIH